MTTLATYRKSLTALVGAVITWAGVAYIPDGHVSRVEWYSLVVALATAAGVWAVANDPTPVAAYDAHPVALAPAGAVALHASGE